MGVILKTIQSLFRVDMDNINYNFTEIGKGLNKVLDWESSLGPLKGFSRVYTSPDLLTGVTIEGSKTYDLNTKQVIAVGGVSLTDFFQVAPGATYTKTMGGYVFFFDSSKTMLSYQQADAYPVDITTPSTCAYIRLSIPTAQLGQKSFRLNTNATSTYKINSLIDLTDVINPAVKAEAIKVFNDPVSYLKPFEGQYVKLPSSYWDGTSKDFQSTHPSVVQFASAWNSYKYWMCHTPYPFADDDYENPTVVASNDGYKWEAINGSPPLVAFPGGSNYNSDGHIFFNSTTNALEIWYREVTNSTTVENIKRIKSTDGKTWTAPELMYTVTSTNGLKAIAPSVWFENGKYYMVLMTDWYLIRQESADGKNWTNPVNLKFKGANIRSWHGNVQKIDGLYYLLNCNQPNSAGREGQVEYYESIDGITWTNAKGTTDGVTIVVDYSGNDYDVNGRGCYRASMIKENGRLLIYYGTITNSGRWYIAMKSGRNTDNLSEVNRTQFAYYNA